jgi:hypothetical protein
VIKWRFSVRIKTINDVFHFLFVNNHLLAPVRYVLMWRVSRDLNPSTFGFGDRYSTS